jgi:hypothetical protein
VQRGSAGGHSFISSCASRRCASHWPSSGGEGTARLHPRAGRQKKNRPVRTRNCAHCTQYKELSAAVRPAWDPRCRVQKDASFAVVHTYMLTMRTAVQHKCIRSIA